MDSQTKTKGTGLAKSSARSVAVLALSLLAAFVFSSLAFHLSPDGVGPTISGRRRHRHISDMTRSVFGGAARAQHPVPVGVVPRESVAEQDAISTDQSEHCTKHYKAHGGKLHERFTRDIPERPLWPRGKLLTEEFGYEHVETGGRVLVNIALGKPAHNSANNRPRASARRAVDGNLNSPGCAVAVSSSGRKAYWEVDLAGPRTIEYLQIVGVHGHAFAVEIASKASSGKWTDCGTLAINGSRRFDLRGLNECGTFVMSIRVKAVQDDPLVLCEFRAFGTPSHMDAAVVLKPGLWRSLYATAQKIPLASAPKQCNFDEGVWKYDAEREIPAGYLCGCKIENQVNCGFSYLNYTMYSWMPKSCTLPFFSHERFAHKFRNKKLYVIGDSIMRGQGQSLLCLLYPLGGEPSAVSSPVTHVVKDFPDFKMTVGFLQSNYMIVPPNHAFSGSLPDITLFEDPNVLNGAKFDLWWKVAKDSDHLIIGTGLWWAIPKLQVHDWIAARIYENALSKIAHLLKQHYTGDVIFTGMAPHHNREGQNPRPFKPDHSAWGADPIYPMVDAGCKNRCNDTVCKGCRMHARNCSMHCTKMLSARRVWGDEGVPILSVNTMSSYRPDAYCCSVCKYANETTIQENSWIRAKLMQELTQGRKNRDVQLPFGLVFDCSHPTIIAGLHDTWNQFLLGHFAATA